MRILYVITKGNWGGAQRHVYDLAAAAKEAGHDVRVAYGERGLLPERLAARGIESEQVSGLARDIGFWREFAALASLIRLYRRERPDVVHIHSSKAGALGALAARLSGVPRIVFTAHGWAFNEQRPWWQKPILFLASAAIVWLSHKTICVSHAVERDISLAPFTRRKLTVIYNGIDCAPLLSREEARASLSPRVVGKYWLGMISELHPTKQVGVAIRAMERVAQAHPEAILVVIGEGEERGALEYLVRERSLENHVFLVGFRPDAARLLGAFDLFVHASRSEAFAYAVLEAGCASLPVVASRVGGIPEAIPDDAHGLLVPSADPSALALGIEALMKDPGRAHEMGARLHARVTSVFSRDRMVRDTLACYR